MTSDFPIPEALRSLGTPLQVYPPRIGAGRAGYFTIGTILALLAGLAVFGIVNPPAQDPPPPAVLIAVMGVLSALALTFFGMGLFRQSHTLILFPEGIARTGGPAPEIFLWSEIREIYSYIHPVAGKHRIVTRDGRQLEINVAVKNARELAETAERTLFDRMMPESVAAFNRGDTLIFGPLRIDQNCLYFKHKRIAWHEVAKMSLLYNAYTRSLQFEVKAAGSALLPWCVVRTQDIPNVNVFKALAERKRPL